MIGNVAAGDPTCGCCDGIQLLTPQMIANRPGLDALLYRVGTHASFLETMQARLSNVYLDIPLEEFDDQGRPKTLRVYPLQGLTTRAADDAAIALLDAWATVGDVLTFYQQRIANEGYLRTAIERRSILELARLVGYTLRPGVSASTYLAFTLEKSKNVTILAGSRTQSLPGPGELPQSFETSQALEARAEWNNLKPRINQPQTQGSIKAPNEPRIYLTGVSTNLKPNDPLLIVFGEGDRPELIRVKDVTPDTIANRTKVTLQAWPPSAQLRLAAGAAAKPAAKKVQPSSLRALAVGLSKSAKRSLSDLEDLVEHFATALLDTFAVLAATPASPDRDQAVLDTRTDLRQLRDILLKLLHGTSELESNPRYLERVIVWIEQALRILDAITITPPPATSAERVANLVAYLRMPAPLASIAPRSAQALPQNLKGNFAAGSDAVLQVMTKAQPALEAVFYAAYRNLAYRAPAVKRPPSGSGDPTFLDATTTPTFPQVYALRLTASLFGNNAPKQATYLKAPPAPDPMNVWAEWVPTDAGDEDGGTLFLDNAYDRIMPSSYVAIQKAGEDAKVYSIDQVVTRPRTAYGISSKTTQITLPEGTTWWDPAADEFKIVRNTVVYTQSEALTLALEPITTNIPEPGARNVIELADLHAGLKAGQWLIVSGERTDITDVAGVIGTELVMLADIQQIDAAGPGDNNHSKLTLANDLKNTYKRETVTVYGNVAPATHGETRNEVLGSGDGSKSLQQFALRQSPLTYLAAPTPAGAESTLKVYVNDVQWHESDSLAGLRPTDRRFITRTDDNDKTSAGFGNGWQGARLPTGVENVKAVYRTGIGKPGNVKADQISLLVTRPLGLKSVINPLPATGGADRESRDQARRNAPLAVMALDRLVSVEDYADFARTFAGIGKADSVHLSNGRRRLVHLTIAGADDIPIDQTSDLYNNLLEALRRAGDPYQPFQVDMRELLLLVISAKVQIDPDYIWEQVEPQIRAALLDTFSFERRELGQPTVLSEVIATIQAVAGVIYVDVDAFGRIQPDLTPEKIAEQIQQVVEKSEQTGKPDPYVQVKLAYFDQATLRPAQLAYLLPDVPATLVLNRI